MKERKKHVGDIGRKTGYDVWIFGECSWHRTEAGARKKAAEARNRCSNIQIVSCSSGNLIGGRPE